MKKSISILLMALSLVLVSCSGGGGGGGGGGYNPPASIGYAEADWFVDTLNYDAGVSNPDQYYLQKYNTEQYDGWIVVYDYDNDQYRAVNVWDFNENTTFADDHYYYNSRYVEPWGLDDYGNTVYMDDYGYLFELTKPSSKDLEKLGQKVEKMNLKKVEEHLVSEFGLSEDRAFAVAKLAQGWKKASKSRQMTAEDSKVFFKEVLGFDASEGLKAFKKSMEGDSKDLDALIVKAAETNDTTPEHMKDILSSTLMK